MGNESKIIRKTDDSAMELLNEVLGEKANSIADIDSYYNIEGTYHFLEFLKCEGKPWDYDPNKNWEQLNSHMLLIWDFTCKSEGILWIVCHEISKEQFKLFKIKSMDDSKVDFSEELKLDLPRFKAWFQKLNSDVLKNK